ncbi:group II intron reverse transcriptase/maturase [Vallitalea guaymasensis]|uniref:Group II intron reverse transcriptase/maturase n=1 Tax=Vallitalea guaymasensis TaxID=1185412 RepID=A0A8J8M7X0_9FIRM|nr:group II intron reverse transcriptase/maturase [Vallitalea guaymasensis]QUH27914.1 group II intron reverse transcriptase/maturase [Vallitalea guaymasensis]
MKVTNHGAKNRKLHKKDYLQMVSTESKEYVEVLIHEKIAENNHLITDFQEAELLEKILERNNLNKAYKKVKSNKGSGGIDKMSVDELLTFLKDNKTALIKQIREGKYKPNPVRRVEIPKEEKGKVRKLGIPTVVDRVIQQAITGVLSPIYEKQFSENSYGFRPNKSAHGALKKCCKNVDEGYIYVVDMDLEKFFDMVCQSKLIEILSRTIKDNKIISIIHKYLNAGVINNGMFEKTEKGVPQGGPLSPLLSNIMLNELDKELTKRGHRYVRYADDLMIFCKSKRGATRVLKSIIVFIEKKLFLKVNTDKTVVAHVSKVKFLGYTFYRYKGKCRLRVHKKSINKMKHRLKELTKKSNGWGNEYRILKLKQYIIGWLNYYRLADMKGILKRTDEWLRRRIRAIYWKQWKRVKTRYRMIRKYNLPLWKVHEMANCRKGTWRSTMMLNSVLTNKEIVNLGYMTMTHYYLKICEN